MEEATVTGFVGVYHADGGPIGELKYVVGHMLGIAHCALCDITHTWRRKPAWDAMVSRLGVPFELRHLNELDDDIRDALEPHGTPAVLMRTDAGLELVLGPADLEPLGGEVAAFECALAERVPSLASASRASACD
ncbi:hypothetical protein P0L94_17795 [Microbacter sp. GSS18]|nr:hypothetical protein P0L94_17795 [Microbacter sp. GSS18]